MVLITGNRRMWFAYAALSLVLFLIVYFAVIRPDQNTANQALKSGLQQSQQVINQAKQQLSTAGAQTSGASGQATKAVANGQAVLDKAQKLTACVASAATDATKLQACQSKYGG
jgi:hypothetical protein